MDNERLFKWLKDRKRKPANLAFTEGDERQAAYWMEMAMVEAIKTEMTTLYSIDCSTGCTCCAYENHTRGLYATIEEAERRVEAFKAMPLLASQFSKTGKYSISHHEAEKLPDGRMIVSGERVISADKIYAVDEKGHAVGDDRLGDESWPR